MEYPIYWFILVETIHRMTKTYATVNKFWIGSEGIESRRVANDVETTNCDSTIKKS